jgi:uncharacterized protein (DUF1697 family)
VAYAIYVAFLKAAPTTDARQQLMTFSSDSDQLDVRGREVYWKARKAVTESTLPPGLFEKTLRMPATLRNITTVRKLGAKCGPAP